MRSADANLFLYAANPASPHHLSAKSYFDTVAGDSGFVVCELVLVEIYMQLRNPAVLRKPLRGPEAAHFCRALRTHPTWQHVDYASEVSESLWTWASGSTTAYRQILDARLALTLMHHGVTEFATANVKDFQAFPFQKVWNPTLSAGGP